MAATYYYADPTGNITLLAPLPDDPAADLTEKAAALMAAEPAAEQVGFLGDGGDGFDISLQMAGGEFCGNATMSAAAIYALNIGLESAEILVRVSGAKNPVSVTVRKEADHTFSGTVSMPAPLSVQDLLLPLESKTIPVTAVRFPGITHLICKASIDRHSAETAISAWCTELEADALGFILLELRERKLTPLVYVRKSGTLFWESSCASGTAAAGVALSQKYGHGSWTFSEPAGSLRIDTTPDNNLLLSGSVTIEKRTIHHGVPS